MPKTVFFNLPSTGHINPTILLVRELIARGHEVIYVCTEEIRAQVEPTGARFLPYPANKELTNINNRASSGKLINNALVLAEIGGDLIPFCLDLLRREQPDYVIFDSLCAWGKQAAEYLKIPAVASHAVFAINTKVVQVSAGEMIKMLFDVIGVMPKYWKIARRIQSATGVKGVGLINTLANFGGMNLVYTSSAFQPASDSFDSSVKFIGPLIADRPNPGDLPLETLSQHPIIYISLGTINNNNVAFYQACIDALRDHPGQVVLSAKKEVQAAIGSFPANFIVRPYVAQLEVLPKVDLFITHGGMNSVHEGVMAGVPLLVVPQQQEQAIVAAQVARHDAGIVLAGTQISADAIRQAVQKILANRDTYREAARKLGDTFRAAGGAKRAVDEIERYIHQK